MTDDELKIRAALGGLRPLQGDDVSAGDLVLLSEASRKLLWHLGRLELDATETDDLLRFRFGPSHPLVGVFESVLGGQGPSALENLKSAHANASAREPQAHRLRRTYPQCLDHRIWTESRLRGFVVEVVNDAARDTQAEIRVGNAVLRSLLARADAASSTHLSARPSFDWRGGCRRDACAHAMLELRSLNQELGGAAMRVEQLSADTLRRAVRAFELRKPGRTSERRSAGSPVHACGETIYKAWVQLGLAPRELGGDNPSAYQNAERSIQRALPGLEAALSEARKLIGEVGARQRRERRRAQERETWR